MRSLASRAWPGSGRRAVAASAGVRPSSAWPNRAASMQPSSGGRAARYSRHASSSSKKWSSRPCTISTGVGAIRPITSSGISRGAPCVARRTPMARASAVPPLAGARSTGAAGPPRGVPVPPRRRRDRDHHVHAADEAGMADGRGPAHGDAHRDHGSVARPLLAGQGHRGLHVEHLAVSVGADALAGAVAAKVDGVDHEPLGEGLGEAHDPYLPVPAEEPVAQDQAGPGRGRYGIHGSERRRR